MRRILESCVILALAASAAYAGQQPQVSGSAPYSQTVNAAVGAVTNPNAAQTTTGMPAMPSPTTPGAAATGSPTTYYQGNYVPTQQPVTSYGTGYGTPYGTQYGTAYGTTTYSSYPRRPFFGLFGRNTTPAYYYTTGASQGYTTQPQGYYTPQANYYAAQANYYTPQGNYYTAQANYNTAQPFNYTPVRRMWPFGLFQRRYSASPATAYTTSGYYSTSPGYNTTTPGYYYTAPGYSGTTATTAPAGTTYTPTMYTAPAGTIPSATNPLPPGNNPVRP